MTLSASAQSYVKLNALTTVFGLINPSVEFTISPHSTYQADLNISPWKKIPGEHHMAFGILLNEYRYFFKEHNRGFYLGCSAGIHVFDMSKPQIEKGWKLEDRYSKGYGFSFGIMTGWEKRLGERWLMDIYLGWSYMLSNYNGYDLDGQIQMNPGHTHPTPYPDPWNGSAEFYPSTVGISFGYKFLKGKF